MIGENTWRISKAMIEAELGRDLPDYLFRPKDPADYTDGMDELLIREMPAPDPDRIPSGTVWVAQVRYSPHVIHMDKATFDLYYRGDFPMEEE